MWRSGGKEFGRFRGGKGAGCSRVILGALAGNGFAGAAGQGQAGFHDCMKQGCNSNSSRSNSDIIRRIVQVRGGVQGGRRSLRRIGSRGSRFL